MAKFEASAIWCILESTCQTALWFRKKSPAPRLLSQPWLMLCIVSTQSKKLLGD